MTGFAKLACSEPHAIILQVFLVVNSKFTGNKASSIIAKLPSGPGQLDAKRPLPMVLIGIHTCRLNSN